MYAFFNSLRTTLALLGFALLQPRSLLCAASVVNATPAPSASPVEPGKPAQPSNTSAPSLAPSEVPSSAVESSVVKVFSTVRYPNVYKPWTKQSPTEVTGSGVVIQGKRILTNAHVVLYASEVQIQPSQGGDRVSATVESLVPTIDLAVLKLDDPDFFDSHRALPLAKTLPQVQDAVRVYGYPTGGTALSVTKGIVSRIEFTGYSYSTAGLRIQIDAAINAGNSGGPAVVEDKMIGLAFSRLEGSENIGYIIPSEEIDLFLQDISDGRYDGKLAIYDDLQTLENPALRSFLKLDKSVQGIVVHKPLLSDPEYPLKEWDLITRIGDTAIDNQGMVKLKGDLRVRFAYLIQKYANHAKVPLTIVRAGKEIHIDLPVQSDRYRAIPDLQGAQPSYFVYGPLVFSEVTAQVLADYADGNRAADWMLDLSYSGAPSLARAGDTPAFPDERLVFVASPFFPHKLAKGYSNPSQRIVKSVNGHAIKNLAHLVQVLRDCKDEFIAITFDMHGGETTVFPRAEMVAATEDILTDNGVRSQGSPEILAIWNAKPKG